MYIKVCSTHTVCYMGPRIPGIFTMRLVIDLAFEKVNVKRNAIKIKIVSNQKRE